MLLTITTKFTLSSASSVGKESTCNAGDPGLIPGLGRSAGEGIGYPLQYSWASLVAQLVKNPPAMWETWVRSLGWEELHRVYNPWRSKEVDTTEQLSLSLHTQAGIIYLLGIQTLVICIIHNKINMCSIIK